MVAWKTFPLLRFISCTNYFFPFLAIYWLLMVQKSQELFSIMECSRFSNPGIPITSNWMLCFKVSIIWFLLQLVNLMRQILKLYPSVESWWTRVTRKCCFSWDTSVFKIQAHTSSTLSISFYPSWCQPWWLHSWNALFNSKHPILWSQHRNWSAYRLEVAKVLLGPTYLETATHPSRKKQLWVPLPGSRLTLSYYYSSLNEKFLISFQKIAWLLPSRSPLTNFSTHKWVFLKSSFLSSTYIFDANIMAKIAVRLRPLFLHWHYWEEKWRSKHYS